MQITPDLCNYEGGKQCKVAHQPLCTQAPVELWLVKVFKIFKSHAESLCQSGPLWGILYTFGPL